MALAEEKSDGNATLIKAMKKSSGTHRDPSTCALRRGIVRKTYFRASLWLKRQVSHPLLVHRESFGKLGFGHAFRLASARDVDTELAALIKEAYKLAIRGPANNPDA